MSFAAFALDPILHRAITQQGFERPTPIQEKAIPAALQGGDIVGLAQTGTGKTAAFALPILHRLINGRRGGTRALIVAPTRELVDQICSVFESFAKETKLHVVALYGGVSPVGQVRRLRSGADIIVACPGRLIDHIKDGVVRFDLLEVLVLDEADRMFDMGFLPDIRFILNRLPSQRQSLFFSATMPREVRSLANEMLRNPTTIEIAHTKPVETISHALYPVTPHLKTDILLALLKNVGEGSALVFTRTKHRAKKLAQTLSTRGFRTTSLQGNLSQNRRQDAMAGFRDGRYQVMVATDIAARGIDISSISHVINYDIPDTAEAYTHRIGRTGRAERTGEAFTLVTREDESMVRDIERVLRTHLERRTIENFNYDVPAPVGQPRDNGGRRTFGRNRSGGGRGQGGYRSENRGRGRYSAR